MRNPGTILDSLVTAFRAIEDLVEEVGNDAQNIQPFYDGAGRPWAQAVYDLQPNHLLVAYSGTSQQPRNQSSCWRHQFAVIWKPTWRSGTGDEGEEHYKVLDLLVNGVPDGSSLKMHFYVFDSACYMADPIAIQRRTLVVDIQGNTIDYWELTLSVAERGDY